MLITPQPVQTSVVLSNANAAGTLTVNAISGRKIYVISFEAVVTAAATGAAINIVLKDGTTDKWKTMIPTSAAIGTAKNVSFCEPIPIGGNMVVSSDAAGTGCKIQLNAAYFVA